MTDRCSTPQSDAPDTLSRLMAPVLPAIQKEARDYIHRMHTAPRPADFDEQKMRFAQAALHANPALPATEQISFLKGLQGGMRYEEDRQMVQSIIVALSESVRIGGATPGIKTTPGVLDSAQVSVVSSAIEPITEMMVRGLLERLKLHFQRGNPEDARYSKLSNEEIAEAFAARCEHASEEGDLLYFEICTMLQRFSALDRATKNAADSRIDK